MNLTSKCWVLTDCPSNNQELHAVPVPRSPNTVLLQGAAAALPKHRCPSTQHPPVPIPGGHRARSLQKLSAVLSEHLEAEEGQKTLQWRATPGQFQLPPPL